MKQTRLLLALAFVVLVAAPSVSARAPGWYRIEYEPVDQAAARAVVLRRSDLGSGVTWDEGGSRRPSRVAIAPLGCPTSRPRPPNLVITGAASSEWEGGWRYLYARYVESQSRVFASARMVDLDARRLRPAAAVLRCLQKLQASRGASSGSSPCTDCTELERVISIRRLTLPRVAPVTFATRTILRYKVVRNEKRVATLPLVVYNAALAKGRTEVVLTVMSTPNSRGGVSKSSVLRLVGILASRMRA